MSAADLVRGHVEAFARDPTHEGRWEEPILSTEKFSEAGVAVGSLAAGAILGLAALIVLLQALVLALTELGLAPAWSSLIVGGVVALIAFALIYKGMSDLKASNLAPTRTVEALKRDAHMVKEQVQ